MIPTPLFWALVALGALLLLTLFARALLGIVTIREDQVGIVVRRWSLSGAKLPEGKIIALNHEPGYQADTLPPGLHLWLWPWMFHVDKQPLFLVPPGRIGLAVARDGCATPPDRILGKVVACDNFQNARAFLLNGGQKGKQAAVLTAGAYRINTALFELFVQDVTTIATDKVGIVTTLDGAPMPAGQMAGPMIDGHMNFQDPATFIASGGVRGLQEQVMLAGQFNLNPWFVEVEQYNLVEVPIGHVGVVVSFVGQEKADISGELFTHGNIVPRGGKGVWAEPLYPGRHPMNVRCMKVELVPTTNIVLNWATARTEAHKLDEKLCTITVRSMDGFTFNLDVSQIINIGATKAPWVISRMGSVQNLVNQVLEPLIGNYFRNAAQGFTVLDFLTNRTERQKEAREHVTRAVNEYDVQSVDTLIGDITPPKELMDPLTSRKVAQEQQKTYTVQMEAQRTRQTLEAETALADKQKELVNEEQNIKIAERKALSTMRHAEGEASAVRQRGTAEADIVEIHGMKEAKAIEATGLARAAAAEAGVKAMGQYYGLLQIFSILAEKNTRIVPDVLVSGGQGGSGTAADAILALLAKEMVDKKPQA
jgi:uncharacterized membrane protein YqiK